MNNSGITGIDKVFVVNMPRSAKRRASMQRQLEQHGIRNEFWYRAIDGHRFNIYTCAVSRYGATCTNPGRVGCLLTHLAIYEMALLNGYESILIFEDDAELYKGFVPRLESALALLPKNWDVLNLHAMEFPDGRIRQARNLPGPIGSQIYIPGKPVLNHAICWSRSGLLKVSGFLHNQGMWETKDIMIAEKLLPELEYYAIRADRRFVTVNKTLEHNHD